MRDPQGIKDLLRQLATRWGIDDPIETAQLFGSWSEIVGPQIAKKCSPTSLRNGVLKLKTTSPAWAAELRYLAPEVIDRVNSELGKDLVREVKASVEIQRKSARESGR